MVERSYYTLPSTSHEGWTMVCYDGPGKCIVTHHAYSDDAATAAQLMNSGTPPDDVISIIKGRRKYRAEADETVTETIVS